MDFDPDAFKVKKCLIESRHPYKTCPNFHSPIDKRRPQQNYYYKPVMCVNPECQNDQCEFSHNETELLYHQELYKTKPCPYTNCLLDTFCPYLHLDELKKLEDAVVKKEILELDEKKSTLEQMRSKELELELELKAYNCVFCKHEPGSGILKCGHLACELCGRNMVCVACGQFAQPFLLIKEAS